MANEMRDRLVEVLNETFDAQYTKSVLITAEHTADHLIADGWIRPPCKVGDTVYIIDMPDYADDYVLDVKVNGIGLDKNGLWVSLELPLGMRLNTYVFPNNLGKTVFLTKKDAEQKLKEMRGGTDGNL